MPSSVAANTFVSSKLISAETISYPEANSWLPIILIEFKPTMTNLLLKITVTPTFPLELMPVCQTRFSEISNGLSIRICEV